MRETAHLRIQYLHLLKYQESTAVQEQETTTEDTTPVGAMVWISATGSKYHSIPDCGNMNPANARQETESQALAEGYEACKECFGKISFLYKNFAHSG